MNIFKLFRDVFLVLNHKEKLYFSGMILLFLLLGIVELLGVSSIAPFVSIVISEGQIPEDNFYFELIKDIFNNPDNKEIIVITGVITLIAITSSNLFRALSLYLSNRFEWDLQFSSTNLVLSKVLNLDYQDLLETNSAVFSRDIINETLNFTNGLINPLLKFLSSLSICIFIASFLVYFNPIVAFGSFIIFICIYGLIMYIVQPIAYKQGVIRQEAEKYRFKLVNEALSSFKLFYTTDIKKLFLQEYKMHTKKFANSQEKGVLVRVMPRQLLEIIIYSLIIGSIILLISQEYEIAEILSVAALFTFAAVRLLPASSGLYQSFSAMTYYSKVIEGLSKYFLDTESLTRNNSNLSRSFFKSDDMDILIKVENLSFNYKKPRKTIIKNFNFGFQNNMLYAVAGKTGSGKSTFIEILLGMIIPDNGFIKFNEYLSDYKNFFAYVPQNTFLFDASIAQNIALTFNSSEVDEEKLKNAIKLSCLEDLVEQLPDGTDSMTGQDGANLSGGQAQRIGIARALYSGAKILILDESTSNLDQDTERKLLHNLKNDGNINCIIMIAHRSEAIKIADKVLLLNDGLLNDLGRQEKFEI